MGFSLILQKNFNAQKQLKSWEQKKAYIPYPWKVSHYNTDKILNSSIPFGWNYIREYPPSFQQLSFTVEENKSKFLYSQESIELLSEWRLEETFFKNPINQNKTKSYSKLLDFLKKIQPMFDKKSSQTNANDTLLDIKNKIWSVINKNELERQCKNNEEFHVSKILLVLLKFLQNILTNKIKYTNYQLFVSTWFQFFWICCAQYKCIFHLNLITSQQQQYISHQH